jgi:hypothetical protein
MGQVSPVIQFSRELRAAEFEILSRRFGVIGRSMLVAIGIILLLAWLFEYAIHLTAGSLVDLLLLFAAIAFALDFLRRGSLWDRRPNWDHRPPKAYRKPVHALNRWLRNRSRNTKDAPPMSPKADGDTAPATRGHARV